jgi:hypothetical protein
MPNRSRRPETRPCPQIHLHTVQPDGYVLWHEWADEMSKTHYQVRCPGCDRYEIWKKKRTRAERAMPRTIITHYKQEDQATVSTTIPLGTRVKPSRKSRIYREMYDELLTDVQERINERRAEDDSDAHAAVKAIRIFAKRSPTNYEYTRLILEVWDD